MKIAFVTGCLAPGKDGVGDYTRLLAEECVRQGHECRLLALHDGYVYGSRSSEQAVGATLQFGRNTPWPARISVGHSFLNDFEPDWVSLQFVHYGFDRRGMGIRLPGQLSRLLHGFPVHLMLHELWVGAERGARFRHRLTGAVQKVLLQQLVKGVSPQAIQTSNDTYVALLSQAGIPATRLPMFGAVPVVHLGADSWCVEEMQAQKIPLTSENRAQFLIVGLFGALHPIWPPEPILSRLQQLAGLKGKQLIVVSAGRLGPGEALWEKCRNTYARRIHFCKLGEQPPARLADFLGTIDFGLATTPAALIGKSASVAAMLDHGVPVIVNRDDVHYDALLADTFPTEPLLLRLNPRFGDTLRAAKRQAPRERLPEVCDSFLATLRSAPGPKSMRTRKPAGWSEAVDRFAQRSGRATAAGVSSMSLLRRAMVVPALLRRKLIAK